MFWITGDYHGGMEGDKTEPECFPEGWESTEQNTLIIAGDFGLPWDGSDNEMNEMVHLATAPWETLFIDGNHECFPYLADQPLGERYGGWVQNVWSDRTLHRFDTHEYLEPPYRVWHLLRGEVYDFDGVTVFCMGGATSIDKDFRVPGYSWFPEELPSAAEYSQAERNLDAVDWKVDYVVTHCCAACLQSKVLYPAHGWQNPLTDELNRWFNMLEERLSYKRWYFGHYHRDRDIDERHTLLYNAIIPLGESIESAKERGVLSGLPERY